MRRREFIALITQRCAEQRTCQRRKIDVGHWGRSSSLFQTNRHTANSAPGFAPQVTRFHGPTLAPDAALTGFAVVFT